MTGCKSINKGMSCSDVVTCSSMKQCMALYRIQKRALMLKLWERGCEPTGQPALSLRA